MAYRARPLSPHLQVYRWQVQMVGSILHRATGIVLSIGSLLITWALIAVAAGPEAWLAFTGFARHPLGLLILFGWSWAMSFHLLAGLRHLAQDAGALCEPPSLVWSSWVAVVGSFVLTAIIWIVAILQWGDA